MRLLPLLAVCLSIGCAIAAQIPFLHSNVPPTCDNHAKSHKVITPELSAYAQALLEEHKVPGLSVGVARFQHDSFSSLEFKAWGNMTENGDKVTPNTLFAIGSCSKAFLSAAMGILIDDFAQGANVTALPEHLSTLSWDTKIQDLFPGKNSEWQLADKWASEKANIRDILSHVSGLSSHDLSYHPLDTPLTLIKRLRYLKLEHELREQFSYNNQMFVLGAHIISTYSGKPFTKFVRDRIFVPLGMDSTTYSGIEAEHSGKFSQSFTLHNGSIRRIPFWFDESSSDLLAGAGSIISNTIDMSKWLLMLLHQGIDPLTNVTLLPKSAFDEVTTSHTIVLGKAIAPATSIVGYGLGWMRFSYQGHEIVTHGGGLPGFLTGVTFLPYDGLAVVSFVNQDVNFVNTLIVNRIIEDGLGLERSDPTSLSHHSMLFMNTSIKSQDVQHFPDPSSADLAHSKISSSVPSLPIERYSGTYYNPGYGSFFLCAPSSSLFSCRSIISNFTTVFPSPSPSTLYAYWPRIWSTHLRLRHVEGHNFKLDVMTLFPEGYGQDSSPFTESMYGDWVFDVEFNVKEDGMIDGLAVLNGFVSLPGTPRKEGELSEVADVYFYRV